MALLDLITKDKPSYRRQLNDPRWVTRANDHRRVHNFCLSCKRSGVVLQVHHVLYDSRPAWDYNDDELVSLCEDCHKQMHHLFKVFKVIMSRHNATNMTALVGLVKMLLDQNPEALALEKLTRLLK